MDRAEKIRLLEENVDVIYPQRIAFWTREARLWGVVTVVGFLWLVALIPEWIPDPLWAAYPLLVLVLLLRECVLVRRLPKPHKVPPYVR